MAIMLFSVAWFFTHNKGRRYDLKKSYLRHSALFIFAFIVVFYQNDIDYLLGFLDGAESILWYDTSVVSKALALSNVALTSMMFGYGIYQNREYRVKPSNKQYIFRFKKEICYAGYFSLFVYLVTVPRAYLAGGYNAGVERGWSNVILVLMQALFVAMYAVYCYDAKFNKQQDKIGKDFYMPFLLTLAYIFIVLVTGRRTEAIRMGVLALLVYIYVTGRNVNYKRIFIVAISFSVIIALVGLMRSGGGSVNEGIDTLSETASISPATKELAGSVNTLHVTVSHFPSQIGYTYGLTFFPNYLVLVPGLDSFYQNNIRGIGVVTSSAEMVTGLALGGDASYGMGSSVVADVYMAFGPIGVFVIFMIFGVFLRYLEVGTFSMMKSPYFLALSFCCYSQFIYVCRGTFANMFLSLSYALIAVFFMIAKTKTSNTIKNI